MMGKNASPTFHSNNASPVAGSFITGIEMVVDGGFQAMKI